jgi:hypothetical protein
LFSSANNACTAQSDDIRFLPRTLLGMLPTFARAGWISKYGLPDLSTWGQGADTDSDNDTLEEEMSCDSRSDDTSTPLGDAQSFELDESVASDDVMQLAARGVSESQEAECLTQYDSTLDCGIAPSPAPTRVAIKRDRQRNGDEH